MKSWTMAVAARPTREILRARMPWRLSSSARSMTIPPWL
jgi:hypothetical protein